MFYFDILQIPSGCIAPSCTLLAMVLLSEQSIITSYSGLHGCRMRKDSAPILLMAEAGHVEQSVSVSIWYMPHYTRELTCNCIYKILRELFIKPDVFSNLVPFIIPLITSNGVQFH